MKFFNNCGSRIEDDDKFGVDCGARLSLADVAEEKTEEAGEAGKAGEVTNYNVRLIIYTAREGKYTERALQ